MRLLAWLAVLERRLEVVMSFARVREVVVVMPPALSERGWERRCSTFFVRNLACAREVFRLGSHDCEVAFDLCSPCVRGS